jgi:hypothetical protein
MSMRKPKNTYFNKNEQIKKPATWNLCDGELTRNR